MDNCNFWNMEVFLWRWMFIPDIKRTPMANKPQSKVSDKTNCGSYVENKKRDLVKMKFKAKSQRSAKSPKKSLSKLVHFSFGEIAAFWPFAFPNPAVIFFNELRRELQQLINHRVTFANLHTTKKRHDHVGNFSMTNFNVSISFTFAAKK